MRAATILIAYLVHVAVVAQQPSASSSSSSSCDADTAAEYAKLPDGRTTYGFDDGGCYLCASSVAETSTTASSEGASVPLAGEDLANSCRAICDADPSCVAFTVGRTATAASQMQRWGTVVNCCLEKRRYPPGAFVDAGNSGRAPSSCQHEVMCWTRYERREGRQQQQCATQDHSTPPATGPSVGECSAVWEEVIYTDDEIRRKIKYINEGCPRDDDEFAALLEKAYGECRAEVMSESLGATVVVLPESVYAFVRVDAARAASVVM